MRFAEQAVRNPISLAQVQGHFMLNKIDAHMSLHACMGIYYTKNIMALIIL